MIRVCLAGATGWVGRPLASTIREAADLELVATVARRGGAGITHTSIEDALSVPSDVFVDYTSAEAVKLNVMRAVHRGRHVVVGSSGLTNEDFVEIDDAARAKNVGVLAVGNFAITAALLQRFAVEAAKHIPDFEIVDIAYKEKMDAPSGTARELAWNLGVAASTVHSLRLPGYTIGLEVRFGREDERLTLHYDGGPGAKPYISGTMLAIRRVGGLVGVVRGMDGIL